MEDKKNSKWIILLIIVLIIYAVVFSFYVMYNKVLNTSKIKEDTSNKKIITEVYDAKNNSCLNIDSEVSTTGKDQIIIKDLNFRNNDIDIVINSDIKNTPSYININNVKKVYINIGGFSTNYNVCTYGKYMVLTEIFISQNYANNYILNTKGEIIHTFDYQLNDNYNYSNYIIKDNIIKNLIFIENIEQDTYLYEIYDLDLNKSELLYKSIKEKGEFNCKNYQNNIEQELALEKFKNYYCNNPN